MSNIKENGKKAERLAAKRRVKKRESKPHQFATVGETRTQQQFKAEVDINNVVEKYAKNGVVTHLNKSEPRYGFAEATDFKAAMDLVTNSVEGFNDLPANVRDYFDNNPEKFLSGLEDPKNAEILSEIGITFGNTDDGLPSSVEPNSQSEAAAATSSPTETGA